MKTYIAAQPADPLPYGGKIEVGRGVDGDQIWHQVPKFPAYRWTNLNGQRVVVDKKSMHIVAVY